jgi:cohesin loading factor subunit SCC2
LGINVAAGMGSDEDEEVIVGSDSNAHVTSSSSSPKPTKRSKSTTPNRNNITKDLKAVYTPLLSTIGLFGTILERAEAFIVANEMDDGLLFTLSAATLSTLAIEPSSGVRADAASLASIVQCSAMDLVGAIFRRYPRHRAIIVEDLFPLMLKLPSSKKSLRTFLVKKTVGGGGSGAGGSESVDYIQPITALTLMFVQSCVVMPV